MKIADTKYDGPRRVQIGSAELWEVEEIAYKKALSEMTTDRALIASLPTWMFPTYIDDAGQFDIVTRSWILIVDGRIGVIDPCTGNGRSYPDFAPAHMLNTPYIERFAAVRRQNIRHNSRRRLAECGPRLGVDVRRRACGAVSADNQWSAA